MRSSSKKPWTEVKYNNKKQGMAKKKTRRQEPGRRKIIFSREETQPKNQKRISCQPSNAQLGLGLIFDDDIAAEQWTRPDAYPTQYRKQGSVAGCWFIVTVWFQVTILIVRRSTVLLHPFSFRLCESHTLKFTHSTVEAFGSAQDTLSESLEHPQQVRSATQVSVHRHTVKWH